MKQWVFYSFIIAAFACNSPVKQPATRAQTQSVARVIPPPVAAPAVFFKKFECRLADTATIYLYLQRNANSPGGDSVLLLTIDDTRKPNWEFYRGNIYEDGGFSFNYFVSGNRDTSLNGWFGSNKTLYVSKYKTKIAEYDSLTFTEIAAPVTIVPVNYYAAHLETPTDGFEKERCDSFISEIDLNSFDLKSARFNVTPLNRLLKTHTYWNKSIGNKPRLREYVSQNSVASIVYFENDFICIELFDYRYGCGAAHGLYSYSYINYSLETGDTVSLTDIVRPNALKQLETIVEQRFTSIYGPPEEGWDFHLTANIAVLRKGLLFKYQVYEVGPFAAGAMEVFIPYTHINLLLNHTPYVERLLAGH